MHQKKPTLTIGIPALNEYKNLNRLLLEIKRQNLNNVHGFDVAIMSDGSTDKTKTLERNNFGFSTKIYSSVKRHGKPYQINKLFNLSNSDLVIILDADISLSNNLVLGNLISAYSKNNKALISGVSSPETPVNFIQKIAYAGVNIWDAIRFNGKHSKLYLCEGSIRCFPKDLYKKLNFPNASADEAYSYLAAKKLGFGFVSVDKAIAKYHLPETIKDYYLQQRRYLNSKSIQEDNFFDLDINKEYDIRYQEKLTSLYKNFQYDPVYTLLYVIFVFLIKITVHLYPARHTSRWLILSSTKNI